jgi:predicted metalloendopeptidase
VRWPSELHVGKILAGRRPQAAANAKKIVALETALAEVQWTKVENRDPVKRYNKMPSSSWPNWRPATTGAMRWPPAGVANKVSYVIVSQPSYLSGFNRAGKDRPGHLEGLLRMAAAARSLALPVEGFRRRAFRFLQHRADRRGRQAAALEVGGRWSRTASAKRWASCMWRNTSRLSARRMDALVKNLLAAYKKASTA